MPLILVVEDELLIAMDLEEVVAAAGWDVLGPAASVADGLRLLGTARPDAAVLDVNLGGELVTPVAEALRAQGVPFVLASGHLWFDPGSALAGATNLGKPTNRRRLVATLTALMAAS